MACANANRNSGRYIPLPRDVEELIARKVEAGEYETPTDVLIHAVIFSMRTTGCASDALHRERVGKIRPSGRLGLANSARDPAGKSGLRRTARVRTARPGALDRRCVRRPLHRVQTI